MPIEIITHPVPRFLEPRILSLPIPTRVGLKIKSYLFAPPPFVERVEAEDEIAQSEEIKKNVTYTRIPVPKDTIRIQDRLQLLLQPPLELVLKDTTLEMPFEPFAYQKQGIAFLLSSYFAVLADEMGLGKTMQAITAVRLMLRKGELHNVLFICPKPLVTNWKREFNLWAPEINVQIIEGNQSKRQLLWQHEKIPVRIANYELLSRDQEFYDESAMLFDLVVLDESQRIKNKNSNTAQAAMAIPRRRNWALTGTPIENSCEDIVGIFEFLSPGYLNSEMKPSQLSNAVGEHILRRTKDKVLTELPPKMIRDAELDLTPNQRKTYDSLEETGVGELNDLGSDLTVQNVFGLILKLKQVCNFDPVTGDSAKLERLLADLDEVAQSGRKAIVFSQWVQTIFCLKKHLQQYNPLEYHGKIPSSQRDDVIKRFKEDEKHSVILMSYGAGSVGLNLQFAGYVFLFDRWWNPAVEDQAINRAHRIGASGPVTVTRFLAIGTIEERIDRILAEKRQLSEMILSGAQGFNPSRGLNHEDIFGLFNLKIPKRSKSA